MLGKITIYVAIAGLAWAAQDAARPPSKSVGHIKWQPPLAVQATPVPTPTTVPVKPATAPKATPQPVLKIAPVAPPATAKGHNEKGIK